MRKTPSGNPRHVLTRGLALALTLVATLPLGDGVRAVARQDLAADDREHRAIYQELVEIDTSTEGKGIPAAVRAVERRLRAAGFPAGDVIVNGPVPACQNVVATLTGHDRTAAPILLLAHLDVVPARRADWQHDPFVLREADGWFYGRGTVDNKAGASILIANMVKWKRDGFVPARDVVMVLTCDEETTAEQGILWLLREYPRLRAADYALNSDAGGVSRTASGRHVVAVQAAEKVYATFALTATNPGGHSSVPRPDNAIYALAAALQRLAAYRFPVGYNEVTRASFGRGAPLESGQLAEDLAAAGRGEAAGAAIDRLNAVPHLSAQMRTTCVATMLAGGHAENALPQSATATVNCRILPGEDIAAVQAALAGVVNDPTVAITRTYEPVASPPSPLRPDVMRVVERVSGDLWPDSVVVPEMSTGATDGLYLRNAGVPVYGVAGLVLQPDADFSHGLDERLPVASLYQARVFWDRVVRSLAAR